MIKQIIKFFLSIILFFFILAFLFSFLSFQSEKKEIPLSQLVNDINDNNVKKITIIGQNLIITYQDNSQKIAKKESESSLSQSLINLGVQKENLKKVEIEQKDEGKLLGILSGLFYFFSPLLFLIVFFWLLSRQTKGGITQTFSFIKAKAQILEKGSLQKEKITFNDVANLKEAKEELKEIVDFLKNPKKYEKMGARVPKGVLLIGPSGSGKTLLSRAVAGEANVPFIYASGSSFVELFVGVGAGRIRDLFETAKKYQPAIIFIDEIDAIGKMRGPGFISGGHEEREQTLNQLLTEMDGFEPNTQVIVLAATNRPDVLDPALLRPGRFDRRIVLDLPDINGREEILKIHCRKKPLALNVNLREIAERTVGFSGADLANVANEAAILAARKNKDKIYQEDFYEAIEKVLLGPERKSHILTENEKKIAAFHEAGHALVASLTHSEPVRKISIVARGFAAGFTLRMPKEERKIRTRKEFFDEIATLLGGYCAEKIKFKEVSTGASNDLQIASSLARKIVKEFGMSSLGPISFSRKDVSPSGEIVFFEESGYSEKLASQIDEEVVKILREAEKKATNILQAKRKLLEKIASVLIEKETIEKEEFEKILKQEKRV